MPCFPIYSFALKASPKIRTRLYFFYINKFKPDLRLVMRIPKVEERYQDNPAFLCDFVKDGTIIALVYQNRPMYLHCPDGHGSPSRLPACLILHWLPNIIINVTPSPISLQSIGSVVFKYYKFFRIVPFGHDTQSFNTIRQTI